VKKTLFCACLTAASTPALSQEVAPVIDNGRVSVRDIALEPGTPGPLITHQGDYVILYTSGGRIRGTNGKTLTHRAGSAVFGHGGVTGDTALGKPAHEVVVELKDTPSNTVSNNSGLPPAFPRPGSRKVFENDRVRVWNYTWLPGKPTPMHFHNTEVVVAYMGDGDIAATTPDGMKTITHHSAGETVFNLANRSHSEELVKGHQSGVMLELK
jgi:quercetin dioxygenase-like cupin family protein